MANTVGRLLVEIGVQLQDLKKGLGQAEQLIANAGKRLTAVGSSLTTGLTLPLIAATGAVVKFGADFEDAMTRSTAIMGDLSKEMRTQMEDAAFAVSESVSSSSKEAAEAYFFLASAGLDAAQSVASLPQVAKFAEAGAFDLARATDLLTDAQSALGLTIKNDVQKNLENMVRISDVLIKANTLANATAEQFSESLTNKLGSSLRLLNKDIEEGVAVLAVYADQGLKGAAAGERASIALRDLQRAALSNRNDFAAFNITVFDSTGTMRSMADIVQDIEAAMAGMSDETRRATLTQLGFQERSIQAILQLVGTSSAIRDYEAALRDAAGTTDSVANRQMQSFTKQMKLLKNELANAAIELSRSLLPALKDLASVIKDGIALVRDFAGWFGSLDSEIRKIILSFGLVAIVLGPIVFVVGKILTALAALISIIKATAVAIGVLVAAVSGPLIPILAAFGFGILALINFHEELTKVVVFSWNKIKLYILSAVDDILAAIQFVFGRHIFAQVRFGVNELIAETKKSLDQITGKSSEAAESVASDWKKASEEVKRTAEEFRSDLFQNVGESARGPGPSKIAEGLFDQIGRQPKLPFDLADVSRSVQVGPALPESITKPSVFAGGLEKIRGALAGVRSGFNQFGETITTVVGRFSAQAETVNGIFGDLRTSLSGIVAEERLFGSATETNIARSESYRQAIVDLVANGVSPASEEVQRLREQVINLNDSWEVFANTVIDVSAEIKNAIFDTFQTLVRGIGDAVARAIVYGEDLGKAMINVLKSAAAQLISLLVQLVVQIVANAIAAAVGAKTKATAEIGANAGITYSAVFAANAGIPLIGPIGAAAAAAAAVKALLAGSAASIAAGSAIGATAFAQGGIVSAPTLALIGEGRETEVVQPLSHLKRLLGIGSGNGRPLIIQTALDGEVVAERTLPHIVDLLKSNGILT